MKKAQKEFSEENNIKKSLEGKFVVRKWIFLKSKHFSIFLFKKVLNDAKSWFQLNCANNRIAIGPFRYVNKIQSKRISHIYFWKHIFTW